METPSNLTVDQRARLYRFALVEAEQLGLLKSSTLQRTIEAFRDSVVAEYVDRVRPGASERGTHTAQARRLGVDRSTYKRWTEGQLPRADSFCLLAAADDVRLPRGGQAVFVGCRRLFQIVRQLKYGGSGSSLTNRQAVCLWAVVRSRPWWMACEKNTGAAWEEGARDVRRLMNVWRKWRKALTVGNIQDTVALGLGEWIIVEVLLNKHEWLGAVDTVV